MFGLDGTVYSGECEQDNLGQYWYEYENGEIINAETGTCLDVEGNDGTGDIRVERCNDKWD